MIKPPENWRSAIKLHTKLTIVVQSLTDTRMQMFDLPKFNKCSVNKGAPATNAETPHS